MATCEVRGAQRSWGIPKEKDEAYHASSYLFKLSCVASTPISRSPFIDGCRMTKECEPASEPVAVPLCVTREVLFVLHSFSAMVAERLHD